MDEKIHPLIAQRRSMRAMSGEELSEQEAAAILKAGSLAPSSYNDQPWAFLIARKKEDREKFCTFLSDYNKKWASKAGLLVLLAARKNYARDGTPNHAHAFDCGAAWENMALQAVSMGLNVRAMGGLDKEKAKIELGVPYTHKVLVMLAFGKKGKLEDLPPDMQEKEKKRTERKPLSEVVFEGGWGKKLSSSR